MHSDDLFKTSDLHESVMLGEPEKIQALLDQGADINTGASTLNHTPLTYAAMLGHKEMVQFLIERGADVHAADYAGRTALSIVARLGKYPEIVEQLKQAGAEEG